MAENMEMDMRGGQDISSRDAAEKQYDGVNKRDDEGGGG